MAIRSKPNWKVLDRLLSILEKEGWSHAQMAEDWGISLATLQGHLTQEMSMSVPSKHDYPALIREFDQRIADGEPTPKIRAIFEARGINWGTFQNRRSLANKVHRSTPEDHHDTLEVHPSTPEPKLKLPDEQHTQAHLDTPVETDPSEVHHGTLEGHQEIIEDISQSVPDAPHISTEEPYQSTPEHLGTPEVHPEFSPLHSGVPLEYSGVPARHEQLISTPMVHPGTPTADDWELWNIIRGRWAEVEKMLADRQVLLSTPLGTPGHTQKKTYVFDVRHIALIDRYSRDHRLDLKDVLYAAFEEFFERRGYREINQ